MAYIEGEDRKQEVLFPESLDDYVSKDNPLRFIDAFVESLDLFELGFVHASTDRMGRPPYNPADLLKLYLYGYMNRLRSSRQLEKATHCNVEVMWLIRKLRPDFKTIADFRRMNQKGLRKVYQQLVGLLKKEGLYGAEVVAVDSSRFKAVNSRERNYSQEKLKEQIARIDRKIEEYLQELDENDEREKDLPSPPTAKELQEKIERLKKGQKEKEKLQQELKKSGQSQISSTDPDSRAMRVAGRVAEVGYNVQLAVDQKHKLIVAYEVTNSGTDLKELSGIAKQAKDALGVDSLQVLADKGYYSNEQIKICNDLGIQLYIPKPDRRNQRGPYFDRTRFQYDPENDAYICPAGEKLQFHHELKTRRGLRIRSYKTGACKDCSLHSRCTSQKKIGREIHRWIEETLVEQMAKRVAAHPEKIKARKEIIEHVFGILKWPMNQGYFLMKGIQKVSGEMSLSLLAYNIKRAINIEGTTKLIQALT
jgi:transposase